MSSKNKLLRLLALLLFLGACSSPSEPSLSPSATTTLTPTADRDSWAAHPDDNPTLNASRYQSAYLKFDLASLPEVDSATLRVYRARLPSATTEVTLHESADTWTEADAAALPPATKGLGAEQAAPESYIEFDVSAFVKAEQAGDGVASFALSADSKRWLQLGSRESATPPQLLITTGATPPTNPTPTPAPGEPEVINFQASSVTPNSVRTEWQAPGGVEVHAYEVFRSEAGSPELVSRGFTGDTFSAWQRGIEPDTTYSFGVRVLYKVPGGAPVKSPVISRVTLTTPAVTTPQPPTPPAPQPPAPQPPAPQPPSGDTIPLTAFDALVNPNTWQGANRPKGNLVVAGDLFTTGSSTGNRHGLRLDSAGAVHSFRMKDGETLRWGVVEGAGIRGKAIESAHQWADNSGYRYVPGQVNPTVKSPPNDQLFHDGTRNQIAFGEVPIRSGPGADRILFGTLVKFGDRTMKYGDWAANATDVKATLLSVHAPDKPGAPGPGNITGFIDGNGQLKIGGRTNPGGGAKWRSVLSAPVTLKRLDSWIGLVYEARLSANADDKPYLKVWLKEDGEPWKLVVDHEGPIGYTYSDASLNNQNYPIMANYYSFHNGNDFDTRYPVRRLWYGFAGLVKGAQYSAEEMMATVSSFR